VNEPPRSQGRPPGTTRIGPYAIVGMIGRGGAGTVFRGVSPEGREVAVKVLAKSSKDGSARFERETRLLGSLGEAEGFVPLVDSGSESGTAFIVMPFVAGGTLRQKLERGPLGVEETIGLVRTLALTLGRAHERGIVHRDLKPENVLFTTDGRPLVADLGLAKHYDNATPGASLSVSLSVAGELRGTAGYMSPEQMKDAKSVGPEADVFALGAIAWECLAGEPAFKGDNLVQVIAKVQDGKRRPLSAYREDVPSWLMGMIDRALATDPEDRFADGASFALALDARAPVARRKTPWLVPLVLLVAGAAALAAWSRRPGPTSTPVTAALRPETVPSLGPAELATLRSNVFTRTTVLLDQRRYVAAVDECHRAFEKSLDPWLHALLADCLLDAGDVESALAIVGSWSRGTPGEARALAVRGFVLVRRNRRDEARADIDRALELEPSLTRALLARSLSLLAAARENPRECDALIEEAVKTVRRAVAGKQPGRATTRRACAEVLKTNSDDGYKDFLDPELIFDLRVEDLLQPGRFEPESEAALVAAARTEDAVAAEKAARAAIALDPLRPISHALLARALGRQGQDGSAEYERARALDSEDASVFSIITKDELAKGHLAPAREALERAIRVNETHQDDMLLGRISAALGDDEAAIRAFERAAVKTQWSHIADEEIALVQLRRGALDLALDAADKAVGEAPGMAASWRVRAEVLVARGDLDAALADANRSIATKSGGEGFVARARVQLARKALDEALKDCDLALKDRHFEAETRRTRGLVLLALNDREGARADLERFLVLAPSYDMNRRAVRELLDTTLR